MHIAASDAKSATTTSSVMTTGEGEPTPELNEDGTGDGPAALDDEDEGAGTGPQLPGILSFAEILCVLGECWTLRRSHNLAPRALTTTYFRQHVLPRGAEYVTKSHAPVQTGVTKSEVPLPSTSPYLPPGQSLQAIAPGRLYDPLGQGPEHCLDVAPSLSP